MNPIEIIKTVKALKKASNDHYSFVSNIIINSEMIKKFDLPGTKSNPETYINIIKTPTVFDKFSLTTWNQLVNTISDNIVIRDYFNFTDIPTSRMMNIVCSTFKLAFNYNSESFPISLLQIISISNQDYLLFIISRWITDKNKNTILDTLELDTNELNKINTIINIIDDNNRNNNNDIHTELKKQNIQLITFKNNSNWIINTFSQFIEETNIYSFAISYHGMGWYIVLSISLLPKNKDKPYFFRLDGGSSEIDREQNHTFFKNNQPNKKLMFNFQEIIKIIDNNNVEQYLFSLS